MHKIQTRTCNSRSNVLFAPEYAGAQALFDVSRSECCMTMCSSNSAVGVKQCQAWQAVSKVCPADRLLAQDVVLRELLVGVRCQHIDASWSMLADRCCAIAALLRHSCSCSRSGSQKVLDAGTKADEAESTPPKAKFSSGDAADKEFKVDGKILEPIVALRMQVARRSRRQCRCCQHAR